MTCEQTLSSSDAICECEAPTTEAPTTEAPTTEAPTTEAPTTAAPTTEAPTTEVFTCDESAWPDKDNDLVCGECKVLVNNFDDKYETCAGYCKAVGLACAGAWEEKTDTCQVKYEMTCEQALSSSDAICECGAPTTEAPTTEAPTTEAPTTEAPTTEAPTTQAPTTEAPTTEAPTTEAPTTEAPTTEAPTTEAPTTEAPTTEAPTTEAPTTEAPTTEAPTTEAPTTEAPTTEAPTTEAPTTEAPTTEAPTTEAPTTEAPTTEAPTTEAPTTEAPTTEAPTTEAPTTEAPTTEAPTTEAPTTEAPTTEAPTTEVPTTEPPTTEAPTTEALWPKLFRSNTKCSESSRLVSSRAACQSEAAQKGHAYYQYKSKKNGGKCDTVSTCEFPITGEGAVGFKIYHQVTEESLWPQFGQGQRCTKDSYPVSSRAACQSEAARKEHLYYQYKSNEENGGKCYTVSTCESPINGERWNIYSSVL